jgi:putative component of membrane protein insertase Oxa1/YidC/SpoIIIJ protein YidD
MCRIRFHGALNMAVLLKKQCSWVLITLLGLGVWGCAAVPPNADHKSLTTPYDQLIDFYRGPLDHLHAVRAGTCPMYPSCSEYSRQAIARYGLTTGWLLTLDRLLRCGRQTPGEGSRLWVNGHLKWYDPLDANTFWSITSDTDEPSGPRDMIGCAPH